MVIKERVADQRAQTYPIRTQEGLLLQLFSGLWPYSAASSANCTGLQIEEPSLNATNPNTTRIGGIKTRFFYLTLGVQA